MYICIIMYICQWQRQHMEIIGGGAWTATNQVGAWHFYSFMINCAICTFKVVVVVVVVLLFFVEGGGGEELRILV